MRIVVTGCGGQLGSELCRGAGADLIGLDLPDFDLTNRQGVVETLCRIAPQAIINTAAFTQVDRAEDEPQRCHAVNADGVAHLVEACRRLDAVLVQLSTDYVFGRDAARRDPYCESDEPGPLGVYANTKLEGERLAARWPKHFVVRTCGLYGQGGPRASGNFPQAILRLAREGRPLQIVDDQRCSPSYVPHVARAIRFFLGTGAFGTYHVVNRGDASWFELAAELIRLAGLEAELTPITTAEYGARAPRPAYSVLDTAKYHGLSGRPEMPRWQDALAEYVRSPAYIPRSSSSSR